MPDPKKAPLVSFFWGFAQHYNVYGVLAGTPDAECAYRFESAHTHTYTHAHTRTRANGSARTLGSTSKAWRSLDL
eukprot:1149428-Pelagomonas_calceolata.AAC.5